MNRPASPLPRFTGAALLAVVVALGACRDQETITAPTASSEILRDIDHHHPPGEGTHLRGGNMTWRAVGPTTAEFTYTITFRRSFYSGISVGATRQFATVHFGNGNSMSPVFTVTYVDTAEDWFEARAVFQHTYAGTGPHTVFNEICCRLSPGPWIFPWDLRNNADQVYRVSTVVNFASAGAPTTGLPPVITCPLEGDCQFAVPATPRAGQTVRWRLATTPELGPGSQNQPGPPQALHAASINPNTGVYTWNTRGASAPNHGPGWKTVYSTQVALESLDANGSVVAKSAVDFLIHLTDVAINAPPVFDSPPSPADGKQFTVAVGQTLTFTVQASDPDAGDVVTLGALGLPAGASFPVPAAANPASTTFSWTPQQGQAGDYIVNFLAVDDRSLNAAPLSISITVPANQPPVARAGGPYSGHEGTAVSFDGTASSDPDGDPLTYAWNFGDGNTGSGATPQHTYADDGTYTVSLTVTDPSGASHSDVTTATIANVAPTVNAGAGATLTSGDTFTLNGSFSDPGVNDAPWNWTIDWGDGTSASGSSSDPAQGITAARVYLVPGTYTVTLTVTDKDGGVGSATTEVNVSAVEITIRITPQTIRLNDRGMGTVTAHVDARAGFDPGEMVPASVRMTNGTGSGTELRKRNNGSWDYNVNPANGTFHFARDAMIGNGDLANGNTVLYLRAVLQDGRHVQGSDTVRVIP
jgi:PKD repeat protein